MGNETICDKCGRDFDTVIYEDNYCEAGACIRLICSLCKTEKDYPVGRDSSQKDKDMRLGAKQELELFLLDIKAMMSNIDEENYGNLKQGVYDDCKEIIISIKERLKELSE